MVKTRFIQFIIPAFVLALASLALVLQAVSVGAEPGAVEATGAGVLGRRHGAHGRFTVWLKNRLPSAV
jgi:TRAP-type mannitol/chloroaromatic compound transport system permease large subunit